MKKKEIVVVFLILVLTICLSFSKEIIGFFKKENVTTSDNVEHERYIYIELKGEVVEDNIKFMVPYGTSLGEIVFQINNYINEYSIIPYKLTDRFYKDTIINIGSSDNGCYDEDKEENSMININTAAKNELQKIYGIGEKRAEKIIATRETKKIESFEELQKVLGVSDDVIDEIKKQAIL